jgi:3-oxoacyl-[acyl-carrier protein] reductase
MLDPGIGGRVALVTGANHGIGAAAALALAVQGARVFIHYYRIPDAEGPAPYAEGRKKSAEDIVQTICDSGGQADSAEADLSDPLAIPLLFDQAEAALGPVEILVNNAADWLGDTFIPQDIMATKAPHERWSKQVTVSAQSHDRHFAVNSRGTALMMVEFARRHVMRDAIWGRIINVSTDGAYCFPGEISYGASKAALESLSRGAAVEFGSLGITVNIVSPGPIQTGWITPNVEEALRPSIPLGRMGQPEDVADVIVFLASEQARWLTGQLLHVGGGHKM